MKKIKIKKLMKLRDLLQCVWCGTVQLSTIYTQCYVLPSNKIFLQLKGFQAPFLNFVWTNGDARPSVSDKSVLYLYYNLVNTMK